MTSASASPSSADGPLASPVSLAPLRRHSVLRRRHGAPPGGPWTDAGNAHHLRLGARSRAAAVGLRPDVAPGLGPERRTRSSPAGRPRRTPPPPSLARAPPCCRFAMRSTAATPICSDDDLFGSPVAAEASLPEAIVASLALAAQARPGNAHLCATGRRPPRRSPARFCGRRPACQPGLGRLVLRRHALRAETRRPRCAPRRDLSARRRSSRWRAIPAAPGWEQKIDAILCYPSQLRPSSGSTSASAPAGTRSAPRSAPTPPAPVRAPWPSASGDFAMTPTR